MPKEYVLDRENFNLEETRGLRCELRWQRDQNYCQIATVADEDPQSGEHSDACGWFVMLNRQDINDLIKLLRRARDQAFGRDE